MLSLICRRTSAWAPLATTPYAHADGCACEELVTKIVVLISLGDEFFVSFPGPLRFAYGAATSGAHAEVRRGEPDWESTGLAVKGRPLGSIPSSRSAW